MFDLRRPTGCIADAAVNEADDVDLPNIILRQRPLNERRRRARRACAADALLYALFIDFVASRMRSGGSALPVVPCLSESVKLNEFLLRIGR